MVGDVGVSVLVDVHVGHLMTGVRPQRPVARLAGDRAGAEAGGVVTVVLLRRSGQGGTAGSPGHQARSMMPWGSHARSRRWGPCTQAASVQEVRSHPSLRVADRSLRRWRMSWKPGWRQL